MKYIIDQKSKKPSYIQLYTQIRNDIISGIYPYKSKIPSKRLIADEVELSLITVEHAYSLLAEEGYIEPVERSGYFVSFIDTDTYSASPVGIENTENLKHSSNVQKSSFPFSKLSKAMRKVITDYGEEIMQKSENIGLFILRKAISDYLKRSRGINAEPDRIVIGSGTEYLYGSILKLLGRDKTYAIEYPAYEKIEQVYKAFGANYEKLPLYRDGIESRALSKSQADVLHITPFHSFPTGITASASKRYEYIRWVNKGERFIIEDDFESEFSVLSKPVETVFSLSDKDNVIYMNTFTKTLSPSIRIGYMVLPQKLVPLFKEKLSFASSTVPTFEQYLITELITSGEFERHINCERRKRRQELKKL